MKGKGMFRNLFTAVLFALFAMPLAGVQAASLSGVVLDEGEPVAMAEVILVDARNRAVLNEAFTNGQGHFRFAVQDGTYSLRISKEGYAFKTVKHLQLAGKDMSIKVELTLAAFADDASSGASDDCD
jgi:uncharacterized membrane protein